MLVYIHFMDIFKVGIMIISDPFPRESGREYALRMIKNNIICLQFAPGSTISDKLISEELGTSRGPVREAIIELRQYKMIEVHPQKKSVIALIDPALVDEIVLIRNMFERQAVADVCRFASNKEIEHLVQIVKLQQFMLENGSNQQLIPIIESFHKELSCAARKSFTYTIISKMSIHIERVCSIQFIDYNKAVQENTRIVEAIVNRDKEKAQRIIDNDYFSQFSFNYPALRRKYPRYFINE